MGIGFDKLREHLRPTYRAHRAITVGGIQPNIITDYGQIWWFVRDANMVDAKATCDKLTKIGEGAALMTGTTQEYQIDAAAWPQLGLKSIAQVLQTNIDTIGMPQWSAEEQDFARRFQTATGAGCMSAAFSMARDRPTCRSCDRQDSSSPSTSRPQEHLA
jgi:aminobenzoyl-glutamate utilization protein B